MATAPRTLTTIDHDRSAAGLTYVYPVVSRRARGLSVGINLNTNSACNWRCIYCQVPGLVRGAAPAVDFRRLEQELRAFLAEVVHGDFLQRAVPAGMRRLNDVALSGNGEPTSAREFDRVVETVGRVMREVPVPPETKLVLITNGSLMHRAAVQRGLARMRELNGEVWFKLDSATRAGLERINHTGMGPARLRANLEIAARLCPTWIQTSVFLLDGEPLSAADRAAYLDFLADMLRTGVPLKGILLYSLARPSMQPEAPRLAPVSDAWGQRFADEIRRLGLAVEWNP
ncbi:MAG: radical SAM protein [Azospira oryzae]|nr:MAG: radical SAM protein [Azospira oryzae]PZP76923.1 MAG: radical SAM protein [Azospira oryzae]